MRFRKLHRRAGVSNDSSVRRAEASVSFEEGRCIACKWESSRYRLSISANVMFLAQLSEKKRPFAARGIWWTGSSFKWPWHALAKARFGLFHIDAQMMLLQDGSFRKGKLSNDFVVVGESLDFRSSSGGKGFLELQNKEGSRQAVLQFFHFGCQ